MRPDAAVFVGSPTTNGLFSVLESPLGPLLLAGDGDVLAELSFAGEELPERAGIRRNDAAFAEVRRQLQAYFAGELTSFRLRLSPGGTLFQRQVWAELLNVPYGRTRSYGEIARAIGRPAATRAVGLANGQNPLAIIVPCHRVIGANGHLTGYGGGLWRKKWLLEHESRRHQQTLA